MQSHLIIIAFSLLFIINQASAQSAEAVLGKWHTEEQKATVEIYRCDNAYCGKIVALKSPNNPDGSPKLDLNNPDESLQSRPIIGTNILNSLQYEGDNEWEDGQIYDPESGKTYSCLMRLKDPNTLEVRGFIGISLVGRSQTWTRVK